mmetsp:Transcript_20530/g.30725  ORF Transcript_20530/g.30725 Transcript_20530/m.30725 type:complete len:312 (+) Transcript_20530:2465-3400(+)
MEGVEKRKRNKKDEKDGVAKDASNGPLHKKPRHKRSNRRLKSSKRPFVCKQFHIYHDKCAHKVGVDSMLLGGWMSSVLQSMSLSSEIKKILDIGTGSGILALMSAQLYPAAIIDAVEPDLDSYQQARDNFIASKFASRMKIFKTKIQDYKVKEGTFYDVVVSNPPFFLGSTSSLQKSRRTTARHAEEGLPLDDLMRKASLILRPKDPSGVFFVIFPSVVEEKVVQCALKHGMIAHRAIRTRHAVDGKASRTLLAFVHRAASLKTEVKETERDEVLHCICESLSIRQSDGTYSNDFVDLTKEFYAKNLRGTK